MSVMWVTMHISHLLFTCCFAISTAICNIATNGNWYEEVTTNEDTSLLINKPFSNDYFHKSSLKEACNFVVQSVATEIFSDAVTKDELPTQGYRIWKRIRQQQYHIKSCKDLRDLGTSNSGVYNIVLGNGKTVRAFCDMDSNGGGWTIFQRRIDGSVNFMRNWKEYVSGFGNPEGNFWLGLGAIHQLTKDRNVTLRFDLKHKDGSSGYAEYSNFSIGEETDKFKIHLGQYTGNIGDSMKVSNAMMFSTQDSDNDSWAKSCSVEYKGPWWHKDCFAANLNNIYPGTQKSSSIIFNADHLSWQTWKSFFGGIIFSEMKLKQN